MGFFNMFKAPEASISVYLDRSSYKRNETLDGKCVVYSSEEFDAEEIRIEMRVVEWTRASEEDDETETKHTVEETTILYQNDFSIAGRTRITENFNKEYPFSINLPSNIPPTYHGRNATNTWMMKGVIAIRRRPDVTSKEIELQIIM